MDAFVKGTLVIGVHQCQIEPGYTSDSQHVAVRFRVGQNEVSTYAIISPASTLSWDTQIEIPTDVTNRYLSIELCNDNTWFQATAIGKVTLSTSSATPPLQARKTYALYQKDVVTAHLTLTISLLMDNKVMLTQANRHLYYPAANQYGPNSFANEPQDEFVILSHSTPSANDLVGLPGGPAPSRIAPYLQSGNLYHNFHLQERKRATMQLQEQIAQQHNDAEDDFDFEVVTYDDCDPTTDTMNDSTTNQNHSGQKYQLPSNFNLNSLTQYPSPSLPSLPHQQQHPHPPHHHYPPHQHYPASALPSLNTTNNAQPQQPLVHYQTHNNNNNSNNHSNPPPGGQHHQPTQFPQQPRQYSSQPAYQLVTKQSHVITTNGSNPTQITLLHPPRPTHQIPSVIHTTGTTQVTIPYNTETGGFGVVIVPPSHPLAQPTLPSQQQQQQQHQQQPPPPHQPYPFAPLQHHSQHQQHLASATSSAPSFHEINQENHPPTYTGGPSGGNHPHFPSQPQPWQKQQPQQPYRQYQQQDQHQQQHQQQHYYQHQQQPPPPPPFAQPPPPSQPPSQPQTRFPLPSAPIDDDDLTATQVFQRAQMEHELHTQQVRQQARQEAVHAQQQLDHSGSSNNALPQPRSARITQHLHQRETSIYSNLYPKPQMPNLTHDLPHFNTSTSSGWNTAPPTTQKKR